MRTISKSLIVNVSPDAAFSVLSNTDRVLRLSPYWSLAELHSCPGPTNGPTVSYRAGLRYDGRDGVETHLITVFCLAPERRIRWTLDAGLLKEMEFTIQGQDGVVRVTQRLLVASEDDVFLKGTALELARWLQRLVRYMPVAASRTPLSRLLHWFVDRVWLKLTLSERRIAVILTVASVLELVVLIILVVVWNLFSTFK